MKNSSDRILTTHVGSLARPPEILELMRARETRRPHDAEALAAQVRESVQTVVQRQIAIGIDVPSDGEFSKTSFSTYVNDRLSGFDARPLELGESPLLNWGRDRTMFRDFYLEYDAPIEGAQARGMVCTAPITYQGHAAVQSDIENFNAALATANV